MALLAEDLLLLLLDDDTGKVTASTHLDQALGGAALVELALSGSLEVRKEDRFWASAKVHVVDDAPVPDDALLADKQAMVAAKERTAQDLVGRLGKGMKAAVLERLVDRRIVERREDKALGLFPRHRWPAVDSHHEDDVRRRLTAVLVEGAAPDERTAGLVALLAAVDQAHRVVERGSVSARDVKRRAKEVADGDWAAAAVRDADQAAQAAMVAVIAAGATASSAGSS
jgi:hypothetical protein